VREFGSERGLSFERRFSCSDTPPLQSISWEERSSSITDPDGTVVFQLDNVTVPSSWSQLATDIVVSKYFRKSGLYGQKDRGETSVAQVVERLAHTIREAGERFGYFSTASDAAIFQDELTYLLVNQYGAFNSPVWFNCGLWHRYQIVGSGGNYAWDPGTDSIVETNNAYERPQCSACFIQSVDDDLMSIYELVKTEARLFKYGSGTGTNFSPIRARQEKLSGGGTSSGLMSFLEVFDRAAGATKSGGTTRRAAKMVTLDMDHPEIVDFIDWKLREERKAKALIAQGYEADFNGEAYHTVSGQNSNNSLRITDDFMRACTVGGEWKTIARTTGAVVERLNAKVLWNKVAEAAWACADPGVQYDTTINRWHTCPNSGRINASNPCSEYMFLDDSACNLASINLVKFRRQDGSFDVAAYRHAIRVFFLAQDILVDFSSYPTERIARNSHRYRPIGLGYANLGTLLMIEGLPYDSDQARAFAAALTGIMTGEAYATSAEIARTKGTFEAFAINREPMLHVMGMHRDAAYGIQREHCPEALWKAACDVWDEAVAMGEQVGYRNAQATVLAPTGTIGLLMDCDTTGIEPDFALVKFKKLAGRGYFKIVNQAVPGALRKLGYSEAQVQDIITYISGTGTLTGSPHINRASLLQRGLDEQDLRNIEGKLSGVFDISQAFAPWVLGETTMARLKATAAASKPGFSLLEHLGFSQEQIAQANDVIIGRMTIEGAPHIDHSHLPVFDCANRCGRHGQRFLSASAHLHMMAAVQPFLSGAISKTVNVPNEATVDDIKELYEEGWRIGLKAVAIYRDGCKASQPLSSGSPTTTKEHQSTGPEPVASDDIHTPAVRTPGVRIRLPKKRTGFTQEAQVGGHKVFLRTGEYADGTLGEIFIDMHKEGAAFRSIMNCLSMSVSIGLQYGVPLETYVDQFTFTRFEPHGPVIGHTNVKFATSIVDYLFRVLGIEYLHRYDLAHVPPADAAAIQDPTETKNQDPLTLPPPEQGVLPLAAPLPFLSAGVEHPQAQHLSSMMGDAPICYVCGHTTVRNGSCYRCLNCGHSLGCS
jgi:ribonucleoside-diphosphate reductase alpha chain